MTNWDTETADKCELRKLIPGICGRCRDKAYCHRPIRLFEEETEHEPTRFNTLLGVRELLR